MPDTALPQPPTDDADLDPVEVERRLKILALEEADAEGGAVPHEEVRAEMLADIDRAKRRIAELMGK